MQKESALFCKYGGNFHNIAFFLLIFDLSLCMSLRLYDIFWQSVYLFAVCVCTETERLFLQIFGILSPYVAESETTQGPFKNVSNENQISEKR